MNGIRIAATCFAPLFLAFLLIETSIANAPSHPHRGNGHAAIRVYRGKIKAPWHQNYKVSVGTTVNAKLHKVPLGDYWLKSAEPDVLINGRLGRVKVTVTANPMSGKFDLIIKPGVRVEGHTWIYVDNDDDDKPDTVAPAIVYFYPRRPHRIVAIGSVSSSTPIPVGQTVPATAVGPFPISIRVADPTVMLFVRNGNEVESITFNNNDSPNFGIKGKAAGDTVIVPNDFRWEVRPNEFTVY